MLAPDFANQHCRSGCLGTCRCNVAAVIPSINIQCQFGVGQKNDCLEKSNVILMSDVDTIEYENDCFR